MVEKHKLAIIGCGMIAGRFQNASDTRIYSHAMAAFKHPDFTSIGFYSSNPEDSLYMANTYDGFHFSSIEEMLSKFQPSVVSICTPDKLHFKNILTVIKSKHRPKVIFVEKPLCCSRSELCELLNLSAIDNDFEIFVNHSRRFDTRHIIVAEDVRKRIFGKFVNCRIDYYGGWLHNGVHLMDFLSMCFDERIDVSNLQYGCETKHMDDPCLNLSGTLAEGNIQIRGHLEDYFQITEIDLFFEKGRILISDFGIRVDYYEKIVNSENENVLSHDANNSGAAMQGQMESAYNEIDKHIRGIDSYVLESVTLAKASEVMRYLWDVKEAYENVYT